MNKQKRTPEEVKLEKRRRNARAAGNGYECLCAKQLREIGFEHVVTSRSESKSRDDEKIDLMNRNEAAVGRLPYNIQCKSYNTHLRYHHILSEIHRTPGVINVIFHKLTDNKGKENKTNKFITLGYYAILRKHDFMMMMKQLLVFGKQQEELVKQNNALRKEKGELEKSLKNSDTALKHYKGIQTGRCY